MNYFSLIFGLITKNDLQTENGGLFLAHYFVLKVMLLMNLTTTDISIYTDKMNNALVEKGLYLRSKMHTARTVSQDEMTGFIAAGELAKSPIKKEVCDYLFKNNGNYPATGKDQYFNPGSYYAWAVMCDDISSFYLAPWYTINLMISTNKSKQNTSSKLIYLTELYLMKDKSIYSMGLWKYYVWRMKLMYGERWIKELYAIYFHTEEKDFPLLQLSEAIK